MARGNLAGFLLWACLLHQFKLYPAGVGIYILVHDL